MTTLMDGTFDILRTSLNLRSFNQNVISSNITNADTPFYKSKVLDFEQEFQLYMDHVRKGDTEGLELHPKYGEDPTASTNKDGNSVQLDRELSRLAKNTIMYNASAQILNKKISLLKYALTSGR